MLYFFSSRAPLLPTSDFLPIPRDPTSPFPIYSSKNATFTLHHLLSIMTINTIDDVIATLEFIIQESETNNSTQGYFAALYLKVTRQVKAGIIAGDFQDNARMERLDVTFAKRYIDAYFNHQQGKPISRSWQAAFVLSEGFWPIVLQHLLSGMNAHINLDLGIASAEVMKGQDIQLLHHDFNQINTILS